MVGNNLKFYAKNVIVAARLRERMEALGISQAELARLVGVAQPTIFKLLNGDSRSTRHLHKIARELRTTPAFLAGETDDPASDEPDDGYSSEDRADIELMQRLPKRDREAVRQLMRTIAGRGAPIGDESPRPDAAPTGATLHSPPRSFEPHRG